jgi:hypothetical protein
MKLDANAEQLITTRRAEGKSISQSQKNYVAKAMHRQKAVTYNRTTYITS